MEYCVQVDRIKNDRFASTQVYCMTRRRVWCVARLAFWLAWRELWSKIPFSTALVVSLRRADVSLKKKSCCSFGFLSRGKHGPRPLLPSRLASPSRGRPRSCGLRQSSQASQAKSAQARLSKPAMRGSSDAWRSQLLLREAPARDACAFVARARWRRQCEHVCRSINL